MTARHTTAPNDERRRKVTRGIVMGSAALAAGAAAATIVFTHSGGGSSHPRGAAPIMQDLNDSLRACLIAPPTGARQASTADAAFAGMQAAAHRRAVLAQRITATGTVGARVAPAKGQLIDAPLPAALAHNYVQAATTMQCDVVITASDALTRAVPAVAKVHGRVQFLVIGHAAQTTNVHALAPGNSAAVRQGVAAYLTSVASRASAAPARAHR